MPEHRYDYAADPDAVPKCGHYRMLLSDAVAYFGDRKRLAACIGVSPETVRNWAHTHNLIPEQHSLRLFVFTEGRLMVRLMPETYRLHDTDGTALIATAYPEDITPNEPDELPERTYPDELPLGSHLFPEYAFYTGFIKYEAQKRRRIGAALYFKRKREQEAKSGNV